MKDYLSEQLRDMAPHRAILRAVECKLFSRVILAAPVLDIGCGDGHFASIAYDRLPIDAGIDIMARDLAEAAGRKGVYRQVLSASATTLPFADSTFNTVVSNCVIEHIQDVTAVLSEIGRVLRPGGCFAATMPSENFAEYLLGSSVLNKLGMARLSRGYGRFFNRISHHHHIYAPEEWGVRMDAAGLVVEEAKYYFSESAHHRFDLSHYLGVPSLVSKRLLGRWMLFDWQRQLFERWLRPFYDEPYPEKGAYQFIRCRKR